MEERVVPYLKEVRLEDNLPGQLQGMYVRMLLCTYMHPYYTQVDAMCQVHSVRP